MATITFDQTGLSAGVTDRARSDGLDTGATVTITVAPSGGTVEFVDVPAGDSSSVSSLSGGPTVWTFTPTASVYGTWLVQYTQGGTTVRRSFAVRTPTHGLRIPAFNEKASIIATIANGASHVADSDDNEGGAYKGWSPTLVELYNEVESGAPNDHAASHQNGGGDEISVAGLSGLLADAQTPLTHATSHQNGGGDEISVAGLSGLLADAQTPLTHASSHQNGGGDEISVAGLSGLLADAQTPLTHASSHQNGGGDEISVAGLSGLLADAQTPLAHASSHQNGGSDEIATATAAANAIPKAGSGGKLASGWTSLSQTTATGPATSNPAVNTLVFCDVSGGAVTVNLPAGHVAGDAIVVKLTTNATNSATIDPNSSETVDGASTLVLSNNYEWAWLVSNGTNWFQIS